MSAGAEFANIAVANLGAGRPATANLYHASSLVKEVAQRYMVIPLDESTPLGTVLGSGGEVWLRSLSDIGTRYPSLLEDTRAAGLASTASLALYGRGSRVIGAMGLAWAQAQAFTDAQKDEVRVVARLAADALGRAQMLEAERAARERTERLQRTMTALVASASLAEVTAAVFQHGLPFGASAARLALIDQQQPGLLVTLNAVGFPGSVVAGLDELPVSVPSPSREAATTSATVYLPTPEDLAAKYPDAYKVLIRSGHQAWIALPLRSSGRMLGVLTLAFPEPHPIDDGPDQISLAALGSAIADALSRAIQHDTDRDLVMSVQRSLLPETLPEHPAVRLGARYMPAETHYGIGGDWYDAVLLPGGRILLLVGDVAGHGLKAAITMGQMRTVARALAPSPRTRGPARCSGSVRGQRAGRIVRDRRRRRYRPRRKNTPVLPRRTSAPATARPRRDPHHARRGERAAAGLWGRRPSRAGGHLRPRQLPRAIHRRARGATWRDNRRRVRPAQRGTHGGGHT